MADLTGRIAVVTGSSRGVGRGIAQALGEAGATIYVTGRSTEGAPTTDGLPGTIEGTARLATEAGGHGIPVRCDHTDDADVEALFEQVKVEQNRLDVLVNNVWGGYEQYDGGEWQMPFWELPLKRWHGMFVAGVRAHYTASRFAAPLMVPHRRGLIVNISFGDQGKYLGHLLYDTSKTAIDRLAVGMARELRAHNVAAVALYPGFVRTERVLAAYDAAPEATIDLDGTESPLYIGRAIAALAADANVMGKSGRILATGALAQEYDFTDIDGTQPPPFEIPDG